jgi:F-type H+-transporting ATPase subunit c
MSKFLMILFALLAVAFLAPAAFAQTSAGAAPEPVNWVAITSGFSMAIASGFCGIAQGRAAASACEGLARNPGAAAAIRFALVLGLVLIESMALYTFAIIFLKVR